MLRYKMLGRDINSIPTQYRTWIVPNTPDLTGALYTGLKSGSSPMVDISAYAITDDTVIADFDLPLPMSWRSGPPEIIIDFPIRKVLPASIEDSQLAIIDGYAYMFGGKITASIYRATLDNPADWIDTGATLPTPLYGAALAIVDGYIYLFGGNNGNNASGGGGTTNTIFSAPVSNPLAWTNHGNLLWQPTQNSALGMYNGNLYLFGGISISSPTNSIHTASVSNPLLWTDTGAKLPVPLYGSNLAQINGNWMLFGGQTSHNTAVNNIFSASISSPTSWSMDGYLPYETAFGRFFTIGNQGYIIGPMVTALAGSLTSILQCQLDAPTLWIDTGQFVPAVLSHSQLAIMYDRVWLLGGSGESAVFACNQQLKYPYYSDAVLAYGNKTRTIFQSTDNLNNPYQALCFPYWVTDYTQ